MSPADHVSASLEPRTEAGKALMNGLLDDDWHEDYSAEAILAIEEQAATEARRELLAKVEGLPRFFVNSAPDADRPMVRADAGVWLAITDVLRLIEESDRG